MSAPVSSEEEPVVKDMSDLPKASAATGEPPEQVMRFASLLAEAWHEINVENGADDKAFAVEGTRFRASWATGCARALSYKVLENDAKVALAGFLATAPPAGDGTNPEDDAIQAQHDRLVANVEAMRPTNPPSVADSFRMGLGTMVHEGLEPAIARAFPGAELEVAVDLRPDVDGSATMDVKLTEPDRISERTGKPYVTVIEIKSVNGYGFKLGVTNERGPAEGPKYSHKVQAALAGVALDADEIVIVWVSLECISVGMAAKYKLPTEAHRFAGEWRYDRETFEPWARREHTRVAKVIALLDEGQLAPRAIDDPEIPKAARIVDPKAKDGYGRWEVRDGEGAITQTGETWWCGYCWHRDRCVVDGGPGAVPVTISA